MFYGYMGKYPRIDPKAFIFKQTVITGDTAIGAETSVWFGTVIRGDVNFIKIGSGTNIQDNTTIHVTTDKYPTIIGNNVTIGHNAVIHGAQIGDSSLIGMGAVILDGCKLGKNTMIAAGTILKMNTIIPEGVMVAGNPGVVKRPLTPQEIDFFNQSASNYIKYSYNYLTSSPDSLYLLSEINDELLQMSSNILRSIK